MTTEHFARPWEPSGADSDLDTLLEGYYWCGRAWEAWQYKTMTEDDFDEAGACELPADLRAWRDAAVTAAAPPPAHRSLGRRMVGRRLQPAKCSCGKDWEACERQRSAESRWSNLRNYLERPARGRDAEEYRAAVWRLMDDLEGR